MVTTIFPAGFDYNSLDGGTPTVIIQLLNEKTGNPTEEWVFHLWSRVGFQGGVELSVESATSRTPVSKLVQRRPNVANISLVTASNIIIAREDGTVKNYQDNTDYRAQLQALDSMKGKLVRVIHRTGVVEGILTNLQQSDSGDVTGRTHLQMKSVQNNVGYVNAVDAGPFDARVRVEVEVTEVIRGGPGAGQIRLGRIAYPVPVPSVQPSADSPSLTGVLGGVGEHACVRTGGLVGLADDLFESKEKWAAPVRQAFVDYGERFVAARKQGGKDAREAFSTRWKRLKNGAENLVRGKPTFGEC